MRSRASAESPTGHWAWLRDRILPWAQSTRATKRDLFPEMLNTVSGLTQSVEPNVFFISATGRSPRGEF
jgi:hypothetical protein